MQSNRVSPQSLGRVRDNSTPRAQASDGHCDGPIGGLPFPLAERAARRAFDGAHRYIVRPNVKAWRAGGFQDPDGPRGPCNFDGSQSNNHLPEIGSKTRRPRIIPDGLLSRLRRKRKRRPLLSAILPFCAVGFKPVLRGLSPLLFRLRCLLATRRRIPQLLLY